MFVDPRSRNEGKSLTEAGNAAEKQWSAGNGNGVMLCRRLWRGEVLIVDSRWTVAQ
jgi:hypothetical protein